VLHLDWNYVVRHRQRVVAKRIVPAVRVWQKTMCDSGHEPVCSWTSSCVGCGTRDRSVYYHLGQAGEGGGCTDQVSNLDALWDQTP